MLVAYALAAGMVPGLDRGLMLQTLLPIRWVHHGFVG
jgi:hypothetical protein